MLVYQQMHGSVCHHQKKGLLEVSMSDSPLVIDDRQLSECCPSIYLRQQRFMCSRQNCRELGMEEVQEDRATNETSEERAKG